MIQKIDSVGDENAGGFSKAIMKKDRWEKESKKSAEKLKS